MTQPYFPTLSNGLRVFSASLLSALLIMMPFVQMAAAEKRSEVRAQRSESGRPAANEGQQDRATNAAAENVFLNPPVPKPAPEPPALAAVIVATKDDGLAAATTVAPGGTITYTVNIKNNGGASPVDDATNVQFSDTIDAHTTLVPGSRVAAVSDNYSAIGNVQISIPDGATDLLGNDLDPDTGNNAGMTVTAETKSSTSCTGGCSNNVTINANGSFTYDPPVGFSGTDTFTYTAHSGTSTATETVKITVANEIWFINNNAGACPGAPCDGRLSHPFTDLAAFTAANLGGAGQPGDNDWIFVYENATLDYAGPATLRNGQRFIGQDATASLATLTGFPAPSGTDPLPVMNSGNGTFVNITGANVNGINLLSGNTLRGFRVGNVGTGTKISGTSFGTLVVGNSGSPDVLLHGTGRALNLTTGTLAVTGGFVSVTTTSSATQGISLSGVADSDGAGAGAFSFGSTTVSGSTTQGILIGTTPADLNFGATSVTGGTNGVSFQSNSGGTRTFVTLGISGSANEAFLHGSGGGNVTVTGAATLSSTGSAISVSAPAALTAINFQAATSATSTGVGITAVNWAGAANTSLSFNSLSIQRNGTVANPATALNATGGGTITVTNGTGSINNTTPVGPAIVAANILLNANFSQINSAGGANGVSLTAVTGTSNFGSGQLTGTATGITFLVSGGTATITYSGNITQGAAAGMVSIIDHATGTITFQTGLLQATLGTGVLFDNADGIYNFSGTTTLGGGNAHIDIIDGSGGTFTFGANTTITSPSAGPAFNVGSIPGNPTVTYSGSITQNNAQRVINIDGTSGNTITFQTGTITGGASSTGVNLNNVNGNVTFANGMTMGTSGSRMGNQAVTITNGASGATYSLGAISIFTNNASGVVATNFDGTLNVASGTVDATSGAAVNIDGPAGLTTLSVSLTRVVSAGGTTPGITVRDTSGTFAVLGTGGACTSAANCTGGSISGKTGTSETTGTPGVRIVNATNFRLTRVNISGNNHSGILGGNVSGGGVPDSATAINGFQLDTCNITANGNDTVSNPEEGGVILYNVVGTNSGGANPTSIINSTLTNNQEGQVQVTNNTATALTSFDMSGNTISSNGAAALANLMTFNVTVGSTANMKLNVTSGTFTGAAPLTASGIQCDHSGLASLLVCNVSGATFTNNNVAIEATAANAGNLDFIIQSNITTGNRSHGLNSFINASSTGTINGKFLSNTVGTTGVVGSGSSIGNGIRVQNESQSSAGAANYLISGNIVQEVATQTGVSTNVGITGAGDIDNKATNVTVTNNTIRDMDDGRAIIVSYNDNDAGATGTVCADISGNEMNNISGQVGDGTKIRVRQLQSATYFLRQTNAAGLATANSPPNGISATTTTAAQISVGGTMTPQAAACTQPSNVFNNVLRPEPQQYVVSNGALENTVTSSLIAAANTREVSTSNPIFLTPIASAFAIAASETSARIAPSAHKAEARDQRSEVRDQKSEIRTHHAPSSKLEGRNTTRDEETGLRAHYATLSKLATRSANAAPAPLSGENVTATIPTLPAGSSVTITFQVMVDNPPNLTLLGPPRVENQGTVTADGGISVLTDDTEPTLLGAADKTATRIDLFDTSTSLVSDLNPSNDGDTVTFTATVNETPAQTPNPTGTVDFIDTSNGNLVICNDVALAGGSAQCAVSNLSAGSTHNIRADYSGDGNFDSSQSNIVAQVVNACVINPVVTNTADSGAGSLREALTTVCSAPNNNITFDPVVFATAQTITLTTGELSVAKNVTITGPAATLTVSGGGVTRVFNINSGKTVTMRELTITGGNTGGPGGGILNDHGTLTLINMTVSGNTGAQGGGIYVDGDTTSASLTVINSTISGNSSFGSGAGIYVIGTGGAATLTMTNSTVSGNLTNSNSGGLHISNATATLTNVTVTNNRADIDNNGGVGGGILAASGTTTLHNTIVAGNFNDASPSTTRDDVSGAFDGASTNNLIGDGTNLTGITHGVNGNQVGTGVTPIDAMLGVLANNGGPTMTHALQPTSPAVEAGSNTAATNAGLTTDQRGTGFPRIADSADLNTTQTVDIGAYELHPTIENITDKLTAEDTAFNFNFNIGDDTGALITSVTATSDNQTLVPDANLIETDPAPANDGVWNLSITPALNANSPADGTATITVTVTATNGQTAVDTFVVTVTAVNDAPTQTGLQGDSATWTEGGGATLLDVGSDMTLADIDSANFDGGTLNVTITGGVVAQDGIFIENVGTITSTANTVSFGGTQIATYVGGGFGGGNIVFTFDADATPAAVQALMRALSYNNNGGDNPTAGSRAVIWTLTDGDGTANGGADTLLIGSSVNVAAVNDAPEGNDNTLGLNEDGTLILAQGNFGFSDPSDGNGFAGVVITTLPTNGTLLLNGTPITVAGTFVTTVQINSNQLVFQPDADENGTPYASFTFQVRDNGGTTGGGQDTDQSANTMTFNVTAVNDAPTFQIASNPPAVNEDAGPQTVNTFATNFQPGPVTATDEGTQTLVGYTLTPTGTTGGLTFSGTPAIDTAGTLTYTATNNTSGTATFDAVATDSGSNTPPNVNQSAPVSFTITVNGANDAPVNTVPGPQGTAQNTPLVFSSGNGNQISVADDDAGTNVIQVTLTATNGTLTLSGTSGLSFAFADGNGTGAGDGTADATMTFRGTLTDVNNALNGMTFDPTPAFSGPASVQIISNDLGNTGSGGPLSDTDVVNITVSSNISVNDASAVEPASPNTVEMVFTVSLNSPAPAGGVSVNFTTQDEPAGPGKAVAGVCGTPGADYVLTSGPVSFTVGQQVKTILVPVCSDGTVEPDETFLVNLSSPVNATIADGTATGTIKSTNTAGAVLISELRTSGPGGAGDDFVEIYNNTNSPLTVAASDASAGYGLYKMGADCNGTPVLIGTIPNGTVIPARGHYLFVGSAYSLTNYGGTGAAAGDSTLSADIETDRNVGLFSTSTVGNISSVNRLDAVGFGLNTGGACNLLREGGTLPPIAGNATIEHSYFRKMCDWIQGSGCTVPGVPKDTNDNSADFWLADTAGSAITGRLGAPGPENLASPIRRDNANNPGSGGIDVFLLDSTIGSAAGANRDRNGGDGAAGTFGSMTLRYRVTNNTGVPVTRLRYRIVDISTANQPAGPTADLRALTGIDEDIPPGNDPPVGPVNDSTTCTSQGFATPCTVTVNKTTLETPPNQAIGGGYNSTLSSGTITTGTPLPNGQSILINFKLGVEKTGQFRVYVTVEALP